MGPLIEELRTNDRFDVQVCVTGQHRQMLDQVLDLFDISPAFDLNLMRPKQSLTQLTCGILQGMEDVLKNFKPDWIFVHGDTSTTLSASLAAYYHQIKVAHVEAGLRTHDLLSPWPEEANRQITARLAQLHFTPTQQSRENLLNEGVKSDLIHVTGNTVIDALMRISKRLDNDTKMRHELEDQFSHIDATKKLVLVTGHRRENFGTNFESMCLALRDIAEQREVQIIYPVHLNPNVQEPVNRILGSVPNVHLSSPLDYLPFVYLMKRSYCILTDSGGIQEEAPALGKPVLVMRNTTERPEAIIAGTAKLIGTDRQNVLGETLSLIDDPDSYKKMACAHNPYGDGTACLQIKKILDEL